MKESQKLIISLLDAIACKFGEMSFTYMYSYSTNQHLVEVTPEGSYNSDAYLIAESDLISDFIKEYPYEGLLFVCNDPYIKVTNPIYFTQKGVSKYFSKTGASEGASSNNYFNNDFLVEMPISELLHNVTFNSSLQDTRKPSKAVDQFDDFGQGNTYAMAA